MVKLKENEILIYREKIFKNIEGHIQLPLRLDFFTLYNYCCKSLMFKDFKPFLNRLSSPNLKLISNQIENILYSKGITKKDLALVSNPDYEIRFDVDSVYSEIYQHFGKGVGYRKLRKFAGMMQFPEFYLLSDKRLR